MINTYDYCTRPMAVCRKCGASFAESVPGDSHFASWLCNACYVPAEPRPTFESIYMELAHSLAKRSTCSRLSVGTVITSTDYRKVIAVGYNGNAAGLPNQCDRPDPGNCGCCHSEENAVINCDSPRFTEKYVFVTHLPCVACAKRLINLGGVKKVFYRTEYRITTSIDILTSVGIDVIHLTT